MRELYLELLPSCQASTGTCRIIDATQSVDQVAAEVRQGAELGPCELWMMTHPWILRLVFCQAWCADGRLMRPPTHITGQE